MKHFLIFLSLFMIACTVEPVRQFNSEDEDGSCFRIHGYSRGYCSSDARGI